MNAVVQKIGKWHSRVFGYVSKKAKTSKVWAIALTLLVIYEIIEHLVYPILVPYLIYLNWWAK
jgi:hypothetical protein|tara:strand:- start:406 stop:594 length:189 start_codon:yes stop_codon:yes gene_type:complete